MGPSSALSLADRLCRPQKVGLFGHRGVGKTTLLTMLYREAVAGRLPQLRLAAGDAATANYLADKILQLESGALLPATLAETELRFQLYHGSTRLELIVKDYQGEQVEVGRQEPIRDFLRDCDAVLLCFDPALLKSRADRLHGEQEAEQIVEDYLALERGDCPHRPMALVLTKADLLPARPEEIDEEAWLTELVHDTFDMTLHAVKQHAPSNALFAVSSFGPRELSEFPLPPTLRPQNLDRPLLWLVESLHGQDEARLNRLFEIAPSNIGLLERCVRCYAQRYAGSPKVSVYEERLRQARSRRRRARGLLAAAAAAVLVLGAWLYDTIHYQQAEAFEQANGDLTAVRDRWQEYASSPLSIGGRESAQQRLKELEERIHEQNREQALANLKRLANDPTASTVAVRHSLKQLAGEFPDTPDLEALRAEIEEKIQPLRLREAEEALEDLSRTEHLMAGKKEGDAARQHLEELVALADRALADYGDTSVGEKLRQRRAGYLHRIDEHDFESAQAYSKREPFSFATRRERYQQYLSRHPQGAFAKQAREAIAEVETAWDKHDFRQIRDLYVKKPAAFDELVARCTRYLAVHDRGRYRERAEELLAWIDRVRGPRDYTIKVVRGDLSGDLARWYTRGPDLSVTIEVNGVKHGPSNIVKNNFDPRWDYQFPRSVTWKPGDTVRIIVRDHDFFGRTVIDYQSSEGDMLAMRLLNGKFETDDHAIWFESSFNMPYLPPVD